MAKYVAKSECETLEAARFDLSGVSYVAVACDGRVHAMPAEAFDLLYEPEKAAPMPSTQPKTIDRSAVGAPKPKPGRLKVEGDSTSALIIRILQEYGPLTHAELAERVYPEVLPAQRGQRLWGLLHPMKQRGIVEKREQPGTHIDKWTLLTPEAA